MLRALPKFADPKLLVGLDSPDDAAVVRLTPDMALVFTTDFFTPVVDDPRDFGRIAAANALSDIYAMGARPLTALNIATFPSKTLPLEILGEILAGGAEVAHEAEISIGGGHTVDDPEPKYGLAVVGTVHPDAIWRKGGALPGDALILTKALGTGILSTALKRERLEESHASIRAMVRSMTTLNAAAQRIVAESGVAVHAATDVTGFGLAGHMLEMVRASPGTRAVVNVAALPALPDALVLAAESVLPGGTRSNREHVASSLEIANGIEEPSVWLACDAQTSGGLLLAVPSASADALVASLRKDPRTAVSTIIGRIEAAASPSIALT